jgi:type VI secretion system protein VasG
VAAVNLKNLVGKLNTTCRRALEGAAGLCLSRTNYNVELEHWLAKLLEPDNTDLRRVAKQYDLDLTKVNRELMRAMDGLKTGNSRSPELSIDILDCMREAWSLTSLEFAAPKIRSGHLLVAMLNDRNLSRRLQTASAELAKLNGEQLQKEIRKVCEASSEEEQEREAAVAAGPAAPGPGGQMPAPGSKTPGLDQYTQNLTDNARAGKIDPVIGRDFEIRQVIDILTRRRQNNPILVGEAGVGKTAVVEGFALRVVAGDVPEPLKKVSLRTLDLGLLQAGAGVKGEFENRLKSVIQEVQASPTPIILFIDEAHTMIGAGGAAGSGDAANLLKPALARGELRTVAATTFAEYKKSFEDDPALKRRFQAVKVDEPDRARATAMMRGISHVMEKHHKVNILDEALEESVRLSARYIPDRQLPDKSVSLLDTACAKVALSQSTTPPTLEDTRREIEMLGVRIGIMERESQIGISHDHAMTEVREKKADAEKRLADLEKRWDEEKKVVEKIQQLRSRLGFGVPVKDKDGKEVKVQPLAGAEAVAAKAELDKLSEQLTTMQGETPLVQPVVNGQAIAEVVAGWTGIPLGKMVRNEIQAVMTLGEKLKQRVVGQDHALETIAERVRTARAGLTDPRKPIGVFMFVGPSGVGKTETAIALADILYGGADRGMTVINMSEYKTEMMVSRLTGPAPGLVGYGKGGVLTEAVRRKPNSIVLLDEIEKSHESVQDLFFQVFDKGSLQDEKGLEADFKNTIILLTSNTGTDTIVKVMADPETAPDAEGLAAALQPDLQKVFKLAFLGRITIVPFFPLTDEILRQIAKLQLGRVRDRVKENHKAAFTYDEELIGVIASRCTEVASGARNVEKIISGTLLPEMSKEFLGRLAEGEPITSAHVGIDADGKFVYTVK